MHGVRPQPRKRKVVITDPTSPGAGAGNFPNMLYRGGPVIFEPQVHIVFLGDWTSSANQARATRLEQFVADMLNSSFMNILSQYGCGSTGSVASSVFLPNTIASLTHNNLVTILQGAINSTTPASHLPEPGPADACVVFLDDSTGVDDTSVPGNPTILCDSSSDTAFGYHTFFTTTAGNPFYFGIIGGLSAACLTQSCPDGNSNCNLQTTQTQEQRQTIVASHELSEMFSNPRNSGLVSTSDLAWIDLSPLEDGEIGDVCAGTSGTITVGASTWSVQLMYSKLDDQQSNGATTCVDTEPYPLPSLLPAISLILDRSTFGKDEVNALLPTAGFTDAFYVVVAGFTPDELGLTASNLTSPPNLPTFTGSFAALGDPAISFDAAGGVQLEEPGKFWNIQRVTFPFTITFHSVNAFAGLSATDTSRLYGLSAAIANTVTPSGYPSLHAASGTAEFELVFQADPFMSAGETWWLSDDMRVFQVTPATLPASQIPLAYSATPYSSDPNSYIQALISELNTNFTSPSTPDTPFNGISAGEDQSALNLTGTDASGNAVVNFALARVHLRGDTAANVRAFFRLFISSSPDTDFETGTTFRSQVQTDSSGSAIHGTRIPLLGFPTSDMSSTIPFFATSRIDATSESMTRQADAPNVQTIPSPTIPVPPPPGDEVYAYFGCWLDINQATPRFPVNPAAQPQPDGPYAASAIVSIPELIMSNHACLVTEISYDPDPIPAGANAGTSDKIGQRNLAWSSSDNPGPQDAHRIPTLFDLRPTSAAVPATELPDELMIEWGTTPAGSIASIYWPQLDADAVLDLAGRCYSSGVLRKKDAHTIQFATSAVTYVPIPAGSGPSLAGLLTVDLPLTVRVDQEFDIVVRRVSTRSRSGKPDSRAASLAAWRYVVGAFQIKIPVSTGPALLGAEESLLGLFKWKLGALPPANRWHPVLRRYVDQVSGRVDGFGGHAAGVKPMPPGAPLPGGTGRPGGLPRPRHHERTGKVCGIGYNRFGDFEGFVIVTEAGEEHRFRGREHEVETLVKDAWVARTVLSVCFDPREPDLPTSIILRTSHRPAR